MKRQFHVCDFCGKTEDKVIAIVTSPNADICDECIAASVALLKQREKMPEGWPELIKAKGAPAVPATTSGQEA